MNILADASLPGLKEAFSDGFTLTLYNSYTEAKSLLNDNDILLCRTSLKVDQHLLENKKPFLIATASSGSDHIDHSYLEKKCIPMLDAKGCNAVAVADYVLATLACLDKAQLIQNPSIGIIGLGHVGSNIHERLSALNFKIHCYDPLLTNTEGALVYGSIEPLYECDILCIHAELHNKAPYPSLKMIDKTFLSNLKPHCILINAARGELVDEEALLQVRHPIVYCTDVYTNEPQINPKIIDKAFLCTPHIAGHTIEAKYKAIHLLSDKIHQLLNLPRKTHKLPKKPKLHKQTHSLTWQDLVLSIYDPRKETMELKKSADKQEAFLALRKAHTNRHDGYTYFDKPTSPTL